MDNLTKTITTAIEDLLVNIDGEKDLSGASKMLDSLMTALAVANVISLGAKIELKKSDVETFDEMVKRILREGRGDKN